MNSHYRTMCRVVALFVLLWPLLPCAASGGPVEGIVFDKETGKPIEGAIVVARWTAQLNQIADSSTMCYHVETTTTDAEGRYRIDRWHSGHPGMLQQLMMFDREVNVTVYTDGYRMAGRYTNSRVGMGRFHGTTEERIEYLSLRVISGTACESAGESYRNLYIVRKAVYDEIVDIADTVEGLERAKRIRALADDTLINRNKPTRYDDKGKFINVNPEDSYNPDEIR